MYTKGKAELSKTFTPSVDEPSCHIEIDGKVYFSTMCGNDKDNAERLIICLNEHDTLKAKADLVDELVTFVKKVDKKTSTALSSSL